MASNLDKIAEKSNFIDLFAADEKKSSAAKK